jgi:uncharacterized cupredoxin-like copper-binding protein
MVLLVAGLVLGCGSQPAAATPPIVPGSSAAPREVNLIARDYAFVPDILDFVPGETVLLHVVNAGLVVHEAVLGDVSVQDAWEAAEAATVGAPPGPTPVVSVPPEVGGVRVVVESGQRVDVVWTVPSEMAAQPGPSAASDRSAPPAPPAWLVGCHIPGHWAKGMQIPIRWVIAPAAVVRSGPGLAPVARRGEPRGGPG